MVAPVALIVTITMPLPVGAFHDGGTGNCDGCHLLDESIIEPIDGKTFMTLRGSDPSSTCLRCHEAPAGSRVLKEYYTATNASDLAGTSPPRQLTPGGDFGWLKKNYHWRPALAQDEESPGDRHGHNIVAVDRGYQADGLHLVAPGGVYPSQSLSCISCHEPHGNYRRLHDGSISTQGPKAVASGSYNNSPQPTPDRPVGVYRLLAGRGYQPKTTMGAPSFVNDPPAAVSPTSFNRNEALNETRVAYGKGMSEWCQNCHPNIHGNSSTLSQHPAGNSAKLTAQVQRTYLSYIASGNLNGSPAKAYSSLVPYEMGTDDYLTLRATANSSGAKSAEANLGTGSPNVMCLTCHRAHASGWDSTTRWNMSGEFMVYNGVYPGVDNGAPADLSQGRTSAESQSAYYGRPAMRFAHFQRSLCNKCHAKD